MLVKLDSYNQYDSYAMKIEMLEADSLPPQLLERVSLTAKGNGKEEKVKEEKVAEKICPGN